MSEMGEALPKGSKIKKILRKVLEAMDPAPPVPKERINPQITAQRLLDHLGNPVTETAQKGTYWDNPFSLRDVLAALGHVPFLHAQNHFDLFPKECEAAGKALQELVYKGVLEIVPREKPDRYNQRVYWRVIDEAKLKVIAQGKPPTKR